VFLAASISLWQGWDLLPVSIYAFFAGIDAIIVGFSLYANKLGQEPAVAAVGFILAGLGGLGAFPFFMWFKDNKIVRWIAIIVLLAAAAIWAVTFYSALWAHMTAFAKYVPATMLTK
jgi:putative membrane protein